MSYSPRKCASIDGDGDRVVYFTHMSNRFVLLDGDRIAVLAALHVQDLVAELRSKRDVSVRCQHKIPGSVHHPMQLAL